MSTSHAETDAANLSPYGNLFDDLDEDPFFSNYKRFIPGSWSSERVVSVSVKDLSGTSIDYRYDLLTGTAITFSIPAIELKEAAREGFRFRLARDFHKHLVAKGTIGNNTQAISTISPFISLCLEQTFISQDHRSLDPELDTVHSHVTTWSTGFEEQTLTVTQHWPFHVHTGETIEIFRFSGMKAGEQPVLKFAFDTDIAKYIQVQARTRENVWVDQEVTPKLLKEIIDSTDPARLSISPDTVHVSYKLITARERLKRLRENKGYIVQAIETYPDNPVPESAKTHTRSLINSGLTTLVVFGAENVTSKKTNYFGSYTDESRKSSKGQSIIKQVSITHKFGDDTDIVFDVTPAVLASGIFTRHLTHKPTLPGLLAYSFIDRHQDNTFMGGCYTKTCNTALSVTFRHSGKKEAQEFLIKAMLLVNKEITYTESGYMITNEK